MSAGKRSKPGHITVFGRHRLIANDVPAFCKRGVHAGSWHLTGDENRERLLDVHSARLWLR